MYIREYNIQNKNEVLGILVVIGIVAIVCSIIFEWWWIIPGVIIDFVFFHEFYPSISHARAKRIMRESRTHHIKKGNIPCPAFFVRLMANKNRKLHRHDQTYRWYLTTAPEYFDNKNLKIIKIEGEACWFFMQECYSQTYVEENKRVRELKFNREKEKKEKAVKQ